MIIIAVSTIKYNHFYALIFSSTFCEQLIKKNSRLSMEIIYWYDFNDICNSRNYIEAFTNNKNIKINTNINLLGYF
jgi:hypothetical protein